MSHPPSTPAKVPASATTYTPATLDAQLRSHINSLLISEGHIEKIQDHLLHALNADKSNWPSAVQSHALQLLRSGEVSTFPALIRRVLEDVRHETQQVTTAAAESTANTTKNGEVNGNGTNGTTKKVSAAVNGVGGNNSVAGVDGSLAMPAAVVEDILKVTRESLEAVCTIDDGT
ncbi:uncharacterized protein BCR38DRAFT_437035 [Pseudomassariella vexata]|uniref:Uncharacterized protein n=1 Tax=Pseudomassariella vexata TaxID=1141098 RepID=A0A1Y2DY05_9PEZI|nr:uncharacterized protein BCR38DRAFT_437035 [Pseudomassariella vexata]ORY63515.1 hypothetical protein BCR38DRAFT_437035 [Pseudomassariella vexata]